MRYYVNDNEQDNGDHEVHTATCTYLPALQNLRDLGDFYECASAVQAARNYYTQVNGCYWCSNPCHTT